MPRRRRLVALLAVVAALVLALDQGTKAIALAHLTVGQRTPLLVDLFGLQLMYNSGAALSLASGMTWVFTVAAVGVSLVIIRVADRLGSRGWALALGLLLGGAVGNLVDRLVRPPGIGTGHVVDFLAYGGWFIGNVADPYRDRGSRLATLPRDVIKSILVAAADKQVDVGCGVEPGKPGRLRQLPRQRVFTPARTDKQYLHGGFSPLAPFPPVARLAIVIPKVQPAASRRTPDAL